MNEEISGKNIVVNNLVEQVRTPAASDKHLWSTLLYTAIVCANHKAALGLSMGELLILGGVLGVYMGQSQLGQWAKLQTMMGGDNGPSNP